MKDKKCGIELIELFMATAGGDFSRCYHGTIKRGQDSYGNPKVWGKIDVNGTTISANARDQWELGEHLDELVLMVLDYDIHVDAGKSIQFAGTNLN